MVKERRRNFALSEDVMAFSKATMYGKRRRHKFAKAVEPKKFVEVAESWEETRVPLPRHHKPKLAKLRASITPGTILILLSGRFRGKRVIFLRQLESGLLLITGPYKINGVPLRRVNQSYVIATSTKVPLDGVAIPEHINDEYFARKEEETTDGEEQFFAQEVKAVEIPKERKEDQATVDTALMNKIKEVEHLKTYLNSRFSLKKGQRIHDMKF